jgi:hypothetical protein
MRSTIAIAWALLILAGAALTGLLTSSARASTGPIPLNCNRACLEDVVNQYLAALSSVPYHLNSPWPANLSGN